jgi:hypothetical protein
MTVLDHQKIHLELAPGNTVHLENTLFNFFAAWVWLHYVTAVIFLVLLSDSSILHWTWHVVHNKVPFQGNDFQVISQHGKHINCTKAVMESPKYFPLHVLRTRIVISRYTANAPCTAGKPPGYLVNNFQLISTGSSSQYTWEAPISLTPSGTRHLQLSKSLERARRSIHGSI